MPRAAATRIETTLLPEDAELLARVANNRNMSVAELVRVSIYAHVEPLRRAMDERNQRVMLEVAEARKLRTWTGQTLETTKD